MWACKRCETLNEDGQDFCVLCNEPKAVKEEQQRTSNRSNFAANKQQSNQNQQSYDANNPQKEPESHKKSRLLNKIVLSCVLLLAATIVIVALITVKRENQGVAQATETPITRIEAGAPQDDANQAALMPVNDGHRIVIDSISDSVSNASFRWGAAIDASGTIWLWDQNDYVARPSDMTDAVAIYTAGVDWSARLFVVKRDGSVWWTDLFWENQTPKYEFQKISGLENITDLEIIDSIDLGLFALDTLGRVWVYGTGKYGVFAMGQDSNQLTTPAVIKGIPPIQRIQCAYYDFEPGYGMVVAQAASGEFYYWGMNLFESGSSDYTRKPVSIHFDTTSSNWSLFKSAQVDRSAYFAWLDEEGYLSIYENKMQPTDYTKLGPFVSQHGGISGLYLLNESGSVYGYGYYASGWPLTVSFESANSPAIMSEISDNQSILAVAFGGWETTALYQDGRIGIWGQSDDSNVLGITDLRFIQSADGGDFKLALTSANKSIAAQNESPVQIGDITLTVESTCDYAVNLISTNRALVPNPYNFEGLSFDTNQILIEITDDSLLIDYFGFLGVPINGAKIQLFNTVDQKQWQATMGDFQASIIFDTLTPGTYYYTVTCEGYETYTSPEFKVTYLSGRDKDNAYMQCILHPSESELTDGFAIQLTDSQGNPVAMKQMNEAELHPCVKYGSSYRIWSGMSLGNGTNQEGVYEGFQFSLRRGSTAILTFDGITNWDGLDVKDHYILIRAE